MPKVLIHTSKDREVIDITAQVATNLGAGEGLVTVFVSHTTTAITTADLDPGTDLDLLDALYGMLPQQEWRHPHNPEHAPAHLLASIVGPSVTLPYTEGHIHLGTWQRIILLEFDGPRERSVYITTT